MKSTIKTAGEYQRGFRLGLDFAGFDRNGEILWFGHKNQMQELKNQEDKIFKLNNK